MDLFASFVHLRPDGRAQAEQPAFDVERDGWQLMTFHGETDADVHADHWEVHPE
ncbi:cupin, partial [Streptomyces cinnamoneus]